MSLEKQQYGRMTEEYLRDQFSHEDEKNLYFNWNR